MRSKGSTHIHRATAWVAATLFIVVALAPLAQASHLTTLHQRNVDNTDPIDPGMGFVWEDDGRVANFPDTNLDGLTNRVRINVSDGIGDGSLLLDTRYYTGRNPYIAADYYGASVTGKQSMYPGQAAFLTFFGWWLDKDTDGIIDEFTDPADHPLDEFRWRGVISGDSSTSMAFFTNPRSSTLGNSGYGLDTRCAPAGGWDLVGATLTCAPGVGFGPFWNESSPNANGQFVDRTDPIQYADQQLWALNSGNPDTWYDESLLMTFQTITVASAKRIANSPQIVDVTDAKALIDVDVYESLNSDVESMWVSTLRDVRTEYHAQRLAHNARVAATEDAVDVAANDTLNLFFDEVFDPFIDPPRDMVVAMVDEILANDAVNETLNDADAIIDDVDQRGVQALNDAIDSYFVALRSIAPPNVKEPNNPGDDFEGRATQVGTDYRGTGNDYSGYEGQFGFWVDAFGQMTIPYAANADLRPAGPTVGYFGVLARTGIEPMPGASNAPEESRGSGVWMDFWAMTVLWNDLNGDHWFGQWCDPDNEDDWDAENDRCADDPYTRYIDDYWGAPWMTTPPNDDDDIAGAYDGEIIGVCGTTTVRNGYIKLEPVGGAWPTGTVIMRNYDHPTSEIWDQRWREIGGTTETVELKFDGGAQCGASTTAVRTVDAMFFARGNTGVGIKTTLTGVITADIELPDVGVSIAAFSQSVTDVDYYAPSM